METAARIILHKDKTRSVERKHPWIFSGAIAKVEGIVADGCWVEVVDPRKGTLGFGHYQNGSIAVRLLCFGPAHPPEAFWKERLQTAVDLRSAIRLPSDDTNALRLVHGEGDGLPGLVVDFYNGTAVVQAHSFGMHQDRSLIATALSEIFGTHLSTIFYKPPGDLSNAGVALQNEYLLGMGVVPHTIRENRHQFYVDWEEGQKTGFFLDQRDNRQLLGHYSQGKTVLNTFCYSGGFSVYALANGAKLVHSVDASEKAVALTRKNLALNAFDNDLNPSYTEDAFEFFKGRQDTYDLIVLDPPAFAKHRSARHQAIKGYQRLNATAIRNIKQGGLIFTFSCSQVVDRQLFYDTVVSAAIQAGRDVDVLHHLSQPADHPVSLFHPEGEYLKGLVLYVK